MSDIRQLVNGVVRETVAADDRGLLYGDGLFETVAVRHNEPRFWSHHVERLSEGCERLGLPQTNGDELRNEVAAVCTGHDMASVRVTVTRGSGPRGYAPPDSIQPTRIVARYPATEYPKAHYLDGVGVQLCSTPIAEQPEIAGLKTLNRLDQVLARAKLDTGQYREGLMTDAGGSIICGTMSNVFVVVAGKLVTPALDRCGVRGVMRRVVLELAERDGVAISESRLTLDEVFAADEIFLTNSQFGLWPVNQIAETPRTIGPRTRQFMQRLAAAGVQECEP